MLRNKLCLLNTTSLTLNLINLFIIRTKLIFGNILTEY